jgi:hypothetical protein
VTRRAWRAALVGSFALSTLLVVNANAWDSSPLNSAVVRNHHQCAAHDHPEPALQGQVPKSDQDSGAAKRGYNCGLELVGFTPLDKTADGSDSRPNANANMAWAGSCAYVSGSSSSLFNPPVVSQTPAATKNGPGIAVVDVHDQAHPKMVRVLRMPGGVATSETLNAITRPDGTGVLVVGQYGNDPASYPKPMDIYVYDTRDRDCSHLRHIPNPDDPSLATYYWPQNIHNLTITPDGNYVYATIPIQAVDLRAMWTHVTDRDAAKHIRYVGDLNDAMNAAQEGVGPQNDVVPKEANPTHPQEAVNSHEAWATDDKTVYIGGQTPDGEILSVIDVTGWLASDGAKPATLIGQMASRGHSVRTATIGGRRYLVHSEESVFGTAYGCVPQVANPFAGAAQPWLTDIGDPSHPVTVSQMGLQINEPQNCPTQLSDRENDSVHYQDVDDADNTHFVMASMWNAGIRVFDVRNPRLPTEVAYFNAADVAPAGQPTLLDHVWGHIHYDADKGTLWFASASGGFFVVRIEDQVRRQLGLSRHVPPAPTSHNAHGHDLGWPGTRGISFPRRFLGDYDVTRFYCTVAAVTPSR